MEAQGESGSSTAGTHPASGTTRRLKLCLAGSGGGHVRQLLDLEPVWSKHDFFFLTEDTALSRSFGKRWRTRFVDHYALGQARLKSPIKMLSAALKNAASSFKAIRQERPDVVITTGAGAMFFGVLWARLLGAKIVMIESFARFDHPSAFLKLGGWLAHQKVVQSPALAQFLPDAKVFDPLRIDDAARPPKRALMFATVGATLPFDRLVNSVARLKEQGEIPEQLLIQTGVGGLRPDGVDSVETIDFDEVQTILREADIVVCHGGTGSIITALRQGCRVVVMPRLPEYGEHYDNHQADITEAFAARGLVHSARNDEELSAALIAARAKAPVSATTDPQGLISYLDDLLSQWSRKLR